MSFVFECMPCNRADTFVPNDSVMDLARDHPVIQVLTGPNYVCMHTVHALAERTPPARAHA